MKLIRSVIFISLVTGASVSGDNYALRFDGVDDGLDIVNPMSGDWQRITWEAWIQPAFGTFKGAILMYRAGYSDKYLYVECENGFCEVNFRFFERVEGGGMRETVLSHTVVYEPDTWIHVAAAYDGEDMMLYINGEFKRLATRPEYDGWLRWDDGVIGFNVGMVFKEQSFKFNGVIDEMRLWSTARDEDQIKNNMYRHISGQEPGLLGAWNLDEGTGQIVHDVSENDNGGRLGTSTKPDPSDPEWVESTAPLNYVEIHSISPQPCPTAGTTVTIKGTRFMTPEDTTVLLGGEEIVPDVFEDDTLVLALPPHLDGSVPLEISNEHGKAEAMIEYRSEFTRADVNGDGKVNISDPVTILGYMFKNQKVACEDATDANDDGKISIADVLSLLLYLFDYGNRPPEPFLQTGIDPTEDAVFCEL
jgi:hypothetical protein